MPGGRTMWTNGRKSKIDVDAFERDVSSMGLTWMMRIRENGLRRRLKWSIVFIHEAEVGDRVLSRCGCYERIATTTICTGLIRNRFVIFRLFVQCELRNTLNDHSCCSVMWRDDQGSEFTLSVTPTLWIEITKDVVALFGECQFVNSMSNVARFQHGRGVFSRIISIDESIDMLKQPIDQIRA